MYVLIAPVQSVLLVYMFIASFLSFLYPFYNLEYGQISTNKGSNNKTKPVLAHTNGATRKTNKQAKLNISMDRTFDCCL